MANVLRSLPANESSLAKGASTIAVEAGVGEKNKKLTIIAHGKTAAKRMSSERFPFLRYPRARCSISNWAHPVCFELGCWSCVLSVNICEKKLHFHTLSRVVFCTDFTLPGPRMNISHTHHTTWPNKHIERAKQNNPTLLLRFFIPPTRTVCFNK